MILVIADDFSGAAELGGVGLNYGLKVEIVTSLRSESDADLLIVSNDTRSLPYKNSFEQTMQIVENIRSLNPSLVYKKIDSVLRGHVIDEIEVMLKESPFSSALVIPVNLGFERIVKDGEYYVFGVPIHESDFADDPEFVLKSSNVIDILRQRSHCTEQQKIVLKKSDQKIAPGEIVIGEATTNKELGLWTEKFDNKILACGAVSFFDAILKSKGLVFNPEINRNYFPENPRILVVSGSTFDKSKQKEEKMSQNKRVLCNIPDELFWKESGYEKLISAWAEAISLTIENEGKAIVSIPQPVVHDIEFSNKLRDKISQVIAIVIRQSKVEELVIAGGGTASGILNRLNISKLIPFQRFSTGAVRMKVNEYPKLNISVKPGSYEWPEQIWND